MFEGTAMKKLRKIMIGSLLIVCLLLGLGYLGLSAYYKNGFSIRTYINGVYCTGKSVEEVNEELNDEYIYLGLKVQLNNTSFYIDADEIQYEYDYRDPLTHYLDQQNPYLWIENLVGEGNDYKLLPRICYDEDALEEVIKDGLQNEDIPTDHSVVLQSGENGFYLTDTKKNILDEEKLKEAIQKALEEGRYSIDPDADGFYYDIPYTAEEEELLAFYDQLEEYQTRYVKYHLGDEEEIMGAGDLARTLVCYTDFLTPQTKLADDYLERYFSKDGHLLVEEDEVDALLEERFAPYNTYKNHVFTTHDGREVTIRGGSYGNLIQMKKEKKQLMEFLSSDSYLYDSEPEYSREVSRKGKNDIGDTYIEVDIGQQKMFYYRDGQLYLETDVVTGINHATREEVCCVYAKQKNRVLRGPGYASPVKYWMPVSGGIGIHDASWRSEYGGEIYKTNGSHGCINTPLDIVEKMFEVVEIGTPCILYYGTEESGS